MATWQYIVLGLLAVPLIGGATAPDFFVNLLSRKKDKRKATVSATPAESKGDAGDGEERVIDAALAANTLLRHFRTKCPEAQKKLQGALACMYEPDVKDAAPPRSTEAQAALNVLAAAIGPQQTAQS